MATFVLIHGAYQGGWIWSPVAAQLRASGHAVYAPSLDGCAERSAQVRPGITTETHADEIVELMRYEDLEDVVLVGTSSGGMVLARVAELARDRVQRIVFADALALLSGETIRDIVSGAAIDASEVAQYIELQCTKHGARSGAVGRRPVRSAPGGRVQSAGRA